MDILGLLQEKKDGIDDLFSAFAIVLKDFPNTHLLIVGDVASNTIIPHLKNEAEKLGILNSITFTDLVDFRLVSGLINSCDILVLARPNSTAYEAGFPTKLGEYMATKKPVVLTRVGDMGKYFGNGNNVVLVEPERVDSIANGISLLINNKLLRDEIGENGFKWMIRNLEYKTVAKRLNEYFRII
ncbi:MAG: glycosyltransferase family 4 protein [Bacteroidales bacterium]|nr:glycosyltransferase family 4 protein [Bacteroidales bacterium]